MTTQLSIESIRSLLRAKGGQRDSRMLDYEIHRTLTGGDEGEVPYYTDQVSGPPYIYREIYKLFPNAEINLRFLQDGTFSCLVAIGGEVIFSSSEFHSIPHVLVDVLMDLKEAWDAAVREEEEHTRGRAPAVAVAG